MEVKRRGSDTITKSSCNDIVAMSTMNQKMMRKRNHIRRREEFFGAHRGVDRYLQVKENLLPYLRSTDMSTYFIETKENQPIPTFQLKYNHRKYYGSLLAVVDEDGMVSVINTYHMGAALSNPRTHRFASVNEKWNAHQNAIFDVIWSHDDSKIITASGDATVCGWDSVTKKQLFRLRGHQMSVKCVRQMPENEFLFASGSRDGDVFLWDIRFPVIKPVGSLVGIHDSPAMSMDHSRRKKRRVTASTTQRSVTCLDFTADSREIATGGATDGTVKFWDVRRMSSGVKKPHNPHPVRTFSCAAENGVRRGISSLAFDQSRSRLLVNVLNDDIRLFYLRRDQFNGEPVSSPVRTFSGHINSSFYVKGDFSPDSDYVVSGSADGNVYIWPNTSERKMGILHSQLPLLLLKGHSGEVNAVSWRPNDFSTLSSCSDDGTVRIWTINKEMEAPSFQLDGICTLKDSTQGRTACLTWKNQVELTEQTDGFAYPVKVEIDIHVPDTACSPATSPRLLSAIRSPAPQPLSPANQTLTMSVEKTKKKPLTLLDLWGKK